METVVIAAIGAGLLISMCLLIRSWLEEITGEEEEEEEQDEEEDNKEENTADDGTASNNK